MATRNPRPPRPLVSRNRPANYSATCPQILNNNNQVIAHRMSTFWQPSSGIVGVPTTYHEQGVIITKLFSSMVDFSEVSDLTDNKFILGQFLNEDIEDACHRVLHCATALHSIGVAMHHLADPTVKERMRKAGNVFVVNDHQRDMSFDDRIDAIGVTLKHHKKACQDVILEIKPLMQLIVAAPMLSYEKRVIYAGNNDARKAKPSTNSAATSPGTGAEYDEDEEDEEA